MMRDERVDEEGPDMEEIRIHLRKGQKIKYLVLIALCTGCAVYGGWQYWFRIPERDATYLQYMQAVETVAALEETARQKQQIGLKLSEEDVVSYEASMQVLTRFADDKPQRPSKYDGLISLVVWFIGGASGLPFLAWPLYRYRNGGWVMHPDGSLRTPKGEVVSSEDITDIDMTSWRGLINPQASNKSTWQARVQLANGRTLLLDDYPWDGLSAIIGRLAHRFHPDTWAPDGEPLEEGIRKASEEFTAKEEREDPAPADDTPEPSGPGE